MIDESFVLTKTRPWQIALGVVSVPVVAASLLYLVLPDPRVVHLEGGLLEWSQTLTWIACVAVSGAMAWRARGRLAATFAWRGIVSALLLAREQDLHKLLNPERLGPLGVHYRIDWWLDGATATPIKLFWIGVVLAALALLLVPIVLARPRPALQLCAADPGAWLVALAILFFVSGWAMDDLMRDVSLRHSAKAVEELTELFGAGCFLASIIARRDHPRRPRSWRTLRRLRDRKHPPRARAAG